MEAKLDPHGNSGRAGLHALPFLLQIGFEGSPVYPSSQRYSECIRVVDLGVKVENSDWKVRQGWAVWLSVKHFLPLNLTRRRVGAVVWISGKERKSTEGA